MLVSLLSLVSRAAEDIEAQSDVHSLGSFRHHARQNAPVEGLIITIEQIQTVRCSQIKIEEPPGVVTTITVDQIRDCRPIIERKRDCKPRPA
jgi:hypothetical protein